MLQGTGSGVGKSTLLAGIARVLTRRGLRVRPFAAQTSCAAPMLIPGDRKVSRAQFMQAIASGVAPVADMNPVVFQRYEKPHGGTQSHTDILIRGRRSDTLSGDDRQINRADLMPTILSSFRSVAQDADIVLIDGADAAGDVVQRDRDVANMGFAQAAGVDVVMVTEASRGSGSAIASLIGTHTIMSRHDEARVKGVIVNSVLRNSEKFTSSIDAIRAFTGWDSLGVVPLIRPSSNKSVYEALQLFASPLLQEDSRHRDGSDLHIVVPMPPATDRLKEDFNPLLDSPGLRLTFIPPGRPLPLCDVIILPGSTSVITGLTALRSEGWSIDIIGHVRHGGRVLGLNEGYQMLGHSIADPYGVDGPPVTVTGLGLLDVATIVHRRKNREPARFGFPSKNIEFDATQNHIGLTAGPDCTRPFARVVSAPSQPGEGATSASGTVMGVCMHGLFDDEEARDAVLGLLAPHRTRTGTRSIDKKSLDAALEQSLDALAEHVAAHIDIEGLLALARIPECFTRS
ncbi:cobyric acid synthase [Acetobacter sacchari]|uniref:Cobyric acid synthase n=1 Tax=Acetobacter sacchari TaxID=2661687 RepID=A0ABS3LTQ9_9PROT|nr:cobyric acid synthase [Acetobacter sacchari]MBO1359289.1 cobyric acid synthase [Acetobacter sacchari]